MLQQPLRSSYLGSRALLLLLLPPNGPAIVGPATRVPPPANADPAGNRRSQEHTDQAERASLHQSSLC
jgi:hypothetical protein